jgi:hypothetical protein
MRVVGRIGVLMLLALAGCATQRVQTGGGRPLLAPASLGEERSVTQVVRGAFGPREMTMNCVVTVKDGVMTVVGLNAMGVRLFTIRYDGTTTTVDNSLPVPAQLTPERLLADLQLVHWPLRPLQAALRGDGWELSEPAPGTRRLRQGERLIAEVHYAGADPWQGRSWLVNLEYGYTLNIESKAM